MICGVMSVAARACGSRCVAAAPATNASASDEANAMRFMEVLPAICFIDRLSLVRARLSRQDTRGRALQISIAEITRAFPDYRVAVVIAERLTIAPERPAALDALIAARDERARALWGGTELSQIPGIGAWRAAYKGFGIKQTRYRSSVERLLKNALASRPLARVNAFVDLYNAVSLAHVLPLGADDLDRITPPLAFRYAREGDSFVDMADVEEGGEPEAPKAGEV